MKMSNTTIAESGEEPTQDQDYQVSIRDLRKTFEGGNVVAVDDINLNISEGEFVVLLGPSGCGKTTTLRCIAGLEIPDSGTIHIDEEDVTTRKPKDRNLAFVFQTIALFPHLSVRRNIRFGLDMTTNLPVEEKKQRVEEAADALGIEDLLDRNPSELSGGQQQRVSLGRAMVIEPAAFLLDEPFSALDANLRERMRVEIQRLQSELDTTMVFVTHDQEEAMVLADKLVVMDDGEIIQAGTPDQIYNNPQRRFIAEFIGSPATNFFDCQVRRDGLALSGEFFELPLPDEQAEPLTASENDQVDVAIRPERLTISDSGLFEAEITVIEPHGDRKAIYLESENGQGVTVLVDGAGQYMEGDTVGINIDPVHIRVFDQNGQRVL
jgi:multiple sugar transport system ATP-binding protein